MKKPKSRRVRKAVVAAWKVVKKWILAFMKSLLQELVPPSPFRPLLSSAISATFACV